MTYPEATQEQIDFFWEHGYLVVEDAIDQAELDELESRVQVIIDNPEKFAFDWAWQEGEEKDERSFRIIQSSPSFVWPEVVDSGFRKWAPAFASKLLKKDVAFWYDQLLAKPPGRSVPTYWHQDEGYWGRNLDEKGLTCWMPLHDVDATNGCMHFIDGGHKDGVLEHKSVEGVKSDLLTCFPVDESRTVVCPIKRGSVTFHHSKTPHMTTANTSDTYRKAVTMHMQTLDAPGEGGHYPWKIYVNQRTGEVLVPERS